MRCLIRATIAVMVASAAFSFGVGSAAANISEIPDEFDPEQCKVELIAENIAFGALAGADHLKIVYTDPTGEKFIYEAFPEHLPPDVEEGFGQLTPEPKHKSVYVSIDPRITLDSGPSACSSSAGEIVSGPDECFSMVSNQIVEADIPYRLLGPNSNSYAYTLLVRCGFTNPALPPSWFVPGWPNDVLSTEASAL